MMKGTVLITGANGGLGSAFVEQFQKSPYASEYRGIYTVRDASKAADMQRVLSKAPSSSVHEVVELDLGSLERVREVAGEINRKVADGTWEPIRTLILNAVFQEANNDTLVPRSRTQDGFESAFGINHLSNYLLTLMLLQSMDREAGRIVVVSSWTHDGFDKRNDGLPVFRKESQRELYSFNTTELAEGVSYDKDDGWSAGMRRYGTSKLLLVLFAHEVQKRLQMDAVLCQISVVCLDPGAMGGTRVTQRSTPFIRFLTGWFMWAIQEVLVYFAPNGDIRPPWKSANDLLVASFDDEYLKPGPTPVYLNGSVRAESSKESKDDAKQARVWSDSRTLARLREGDTVLTSWQ